MLTIKCIDCKKETMVPTKHAQSRQLRCINCSKNKEKRERHIRWMKKKLSKNDAEIIRNTQRGHSISLRKNEIWVKKNLVSGINQTEELASDNAKRN